MAGAGYRDEPPTEDPTKLEPSKIEPPKRRNVLSRKQIEARKNARLEEIKTRYAEKTRYNAEKNREKELSIIEKARLKRINAALGTKTISGEPQNFVVEKPLAPNAMDRYEAQQLERKNAIRTQDKFVPVQKM